MPLSLDPCRGAELEVTEASLKWIKPGKHGLRVDKEHWGSTLSVMFYCFESKYVEMLGFLITAASPSEACRSMEGSPDPHKSTRGKEQGKRHTVSTCSFPSLLQKMAVFARSAGLCVGRWGTGPALDLCGIWTVPPILQASVPPSRAMNVGIT